MKRNRTNRFGLALLGCVTALALFVAPAAGGEIDDLKAQIKALMNRLEAIEAREKMMKADMKAAAEATQKKAVATGDFPGSWKMPGTNTSVSFSGYVKLDAIYDFDQDMGDTFFGYDSGGSASGILLDGDDSGNPNISMHARQTRLRFDSLTPTKMGELKTRIETDFAYNDGTPLRLRHAYATVGGVLAGQTWTTLMDENTYADTIDFEGPVGVVAARTPQLRYTSAMGKNLTAQVALEDPGAPTILMAGGKTSSQDRIPSLVGALRLKTSWGAVNVSGLVGQVLYEAGAVEESITISALHLGANVGLGKDTRLWGTFNVGQGGLNSMIGAPAAAILGAGGELEALDLMGGFVGLTHNWSSSVSSGVYYGWIDSDFEDPAAFADLSQSQRTLHVNFWWSPAPKMRAGVEFIQGWRETNDGREGDATRLQLGLVYSF